MTCTINGKKWAINTLIAESENLKPFKIKVSTIDKSGYPWSKDITLHNLCYHMSRINACSLEFPIILSETGAIMDGYHRICKAVLLKEEFITAVQFDHDPDHIPSIV